jgi:hypothetical protein
LPGINPRRAARAKGIHWKEDAMANRQDGDNHPDGQQGDKTHERFIEQLEEGTHEESREERLARDREDQASKGGRRLVEDREQHDEAEKNSEATQAFVERDRNREP